MRDEQREAVDRLNKDKNKPLACGDITTCFIDDLDTVLSLIKEQEIYIKKSHDTTEEMNRDITILIDEMKQKDKQIDLMAGFIGQDMMCIRPEIECNKMTHDCKECIKQYFADKAKGQ